MNLKPLVLASTSIYRSELLRRLQLPFQIANPGIDETPQPGESPKQTTLRLSLEKAHAVAAQYPDALIIGSDQIAVLGQHSLGKPLSHENAVRQLRTMRGQTVTFFTALTLLNTQTWEAQTGVVENHVTFRPFSDEEIESYLIKEKPYNCAGSAKAEGLGIALISSMEGNDPNALIGLPLILLVDMLKNQRVQIP